MHLLSTSLIFFIHLVSPNIESLFINILIWIIYTEGNPEENLPSSYQRRKHSNLLSKDNNQVEEKDQSKQNTLPSLVMETSRNQRTMLDETKDMIYLLLKLLLLYAVFVLMIFYFLVPL